MAALFSSHYGVIRVLLGQEDKSPSSLTLDASINSLEKWFTMNCYLSSPIFLCNLSPVVLPCGLAWKVSTLSLPDVMQASQWLLALCNCFCEKRGKRRSPRGWSHCWCKQCCLSCTLFCKPGAVALCGLLRHISALLPAQQMLHTLTWHKAPGCSMKELWHLTVSQALWLSGGCSNRGIRRLDSLHTTQWKWA